jgi:Ca-activated chloride channel family protein
MSASDFEDDTKDGGEVGAGQQVTVAYEIKYANDSEPNGGLKYQQSVLTEQSESNEICTVFVRYKDPEAKNSVEKEFPVIGITEEVSDDFNFVASVIELSMLVRDSKFIGSATFNSAYDLAKSGATDEYKDKFCEMIRLIEAAKK